MLNDQFHNEFRSARTWEYDLDKYYLYGKFYGKQNEYTDETWKVFAARIIKLKAFE